MEHRGSAVSWGVQCVGEYSGLGSTVGWGVQWVGEYSGHHSMWRYEGSEVVNGVACESLRETWKRTASSAVKALDSCCICGHCPDR